ncbi:MAG TPA: hypothetical protein V6D15_13285 [Oculatellaceae cyanobacterium]|jgi:hypothetical protein
MKKILLIFIFLVAGSSAVMAFFWQQATELPSWYNTTTEATNIDPENNINGLLKTDKNTANNFQIPEKVTNTEANKLASENNIKIVLKADKNTANNFKMPEIFTTTETNNIASENNPKVILNAAKNTANNFEIPETSPKLADSKTVNINLTEGDINKIIVNQIAPPTSEYQPNNSVKGVNTKIRNGKIETGIVVNISEFSNTPFAQNNQDKLKKLTEKFPFLNNREVYIGISGTPYIENGNLKFDDNTQIKVGNLSFTIADLSQKTGISKERIEQRLNLELKSRRINIENLEIRDNNSLINNSTN